MKKIISILIAVLFVISSFSFVVFAKDPVSLSLTSEQVYAGDEITLNLYVSGNSNISGAVIDISYDKDMLEFVSAKEGAILDPKANISIRNIKNDNNYIRFTYLSTSSSIISEGILMSVTFKALESAIGETKLVISIPNPGDFITKDLENLKYNVVNSEVKILSKNNVDESTTSEIIETSTNVEERTTVITESTTIVNDVDEDNSDFDIVLISVICLGLLFLTIAIIFIKKKKS